VLSFAKTENHVVCLIIQHSVVVFALVHKINLACCSHEIVTMLWHNSLHELEHNPLTLVCFSSMDLFSFLF
jgi:hypothetical protein